MAAILERTRMAFAMCDCSHVTTRQGLKLTASYA
jgi:hypothetical protein